MKKKRKRRGNRARAMVMQPRFRSRLVPARKGTKSYRRKPKHQRPAGDDD